VYEILQVNFKNAERRRDNESIVLQINPKQWWLKGRLFVSTNIYKPRFMREIAQRYANL
jgi:hypothetical protein